MGEPRGDTPLAVQQNEQNQYRFAASSQDVQIGGFFIGGVLSPENPLTCGFAAPELAGPGPLFCLWNTKPKVSDCV